MEPWFGGSHRAWAEGFARHSAHEVELLTLPADGWMWRLRGAALTLAGRVTARPDLVMASSLLDLAAFLGHARRLLHAVPAVLYMHENQLTYPVPAGADRDMSLAFINWNSMAAADLTIFNSEFHRDEWFAELGQFLSTHPDPRHDTLIDDARARTTVMPVGVEGSALAVDPASKPDPPLVIWNQRWEHDKRPDAVAAILSEVDVRTTHFRVALCGENPYRAIPPSFLDFQERLDDRLIQFGFANRAHYEQLLHDASIVLSAADHEFFGVAVAEAMAAGAVPVLPDRLGYPELLKGSGVEPFVTDADAVDRIAGLIGDRPTRVDTARAVAAAAGRFDWSTVAPQYDAAIESVVR